MPIAFIIYFMVVAGVTKKYFYCSIFFFRGGLKIVMH